MTPILVFDLETIPDITGLRALHAGEQGWGPEVPDAQIAAKAFEQRLAATDGKSDFLQHPLHRICAIGCVFRDDNGFKVRCLGTEQDDEATLLTQFFRTIDKHKPQLVSWNGVGFDQPVLHYRALVHGVTASTYWDWGDDDRDFKWNNYLSRYHSRHIDLMDVLANYTGRANAKLDEIAKLCGFAGKLGMDGGKVWDAVQAGQLDQVRAYCETDVVNTYLVFTRFRLMRGEMTAEQYKHEMQFVRDELGRTPGAHWPQFLAAWHNMGV